MPPWNARRTSARNERSSARGSCPTTSMTCGRSLRKSEEPMTIELSESGRASLGAICDTFVPGENGLPSATDIHVPDVILGAMGANPSADVRDGFAGLIEGWDSGFASLPKEERER